jgi:hypothetical protein
MDRITHHGQDLAVIVRADDCRTGYNFISANDWAIQVGFNNYSADQFCEPHVHLPKTKDQMESLAGQAMEILHIVDGRCSLAVYWERTLVKELELRRGDTAILVAGGHGIRFLEPTKIFECKQGPYLSRSADKRAL